MPGVGSLTALAFVLTVEVLNASTTVGGWVPTSGSFQRRTNRETVIPSGASPSEVRQDAQATLLGPSVSVLSAHELNYERFAPQTSRGRDNPERGIREFVVGTGGRGHYPIVEPIANSEVHNDETHGVLKLTLDPKSYEWRFVPVEGETFSDSGSARCH